MQEIFIVLFFVFVSIIIYFYYYLFYLKPKKDSESFKIDLVKFNKSITNEDRENIKLLSEKIIWNVNIDTKLIDEIDNSLKSLEVKYPELQVIRQDIHNRKLDWNVERPYVG